MASNTQTKWIILVVLVIVAFFLVRGSTTEPTTSVVVTSSSELVPPSQTTASSPSDDDGVGADKQMIKAIRRRSSDGKVVVVTSVPGLTWKPKIGSTEWLLKRLAKYTWGTAQEYCRRHAGYKCVVEQPADEGEQQTSVCKAIGKHLRDNEFVLWVGTDAMIANINTPVRDFFSTPEGAAAGATATAVHSHDKESNMVLVRRTTETLAWTESGNCDADCYDRDKGNRAARNVDELLRCGVKDFNVRLRMMPSFSGQFQPVQPELTPVVDRFVVGRFGATFSYCVSGGSSDGGAGGRGGISVDACILRMRLALEHFSVAYGYVAQPVTIVPGDVRETDPAIDADAPIGLSTPPATSEPTHPFHRRQEDATTDSPAQTEQQQTSTAADVATAQPQRTTRGDGSSDSDTVATTTTTTTEATPPTLTRAASLRNRPRIAILSFVAYPSDFRKRKFTEELTHQLFKHAWPNRLAYCRRWGYDCILENATTLTHDAPPHLQLHGRHAAFGKITAVRKWLPKYDWVMWLDADALIMNHNITIESILDQARPPAVSPEFLKKQQESGVLNATTTLDFLLSRDWNGINTGVFFFRNTRWANDFADRVDRGLSDEECDLPRSWWEQRVVMCLLDRKLRGNSKELDEDLRHVFIFDRQRTFNSYGQPTDEGRASAAWQKGDFIAHFPNCKSHQPLCRRYVGIMYKKALKFNGYHKELRTLAFRPLPDPPTFHYPS